MKYFVIATKWDPKQEKQIKYIAGEFNNFVNAEIFRTAYNERYSADAMIIREDNLLSD